MFHIVGHACECWGCYNINRQLQLMLCISASQMIVEMLFMGMNPNPTNNFLSEAQPIARELTVVEENAIFYAGGYVFE